MDIQAAKTRCEAATVAQAFHEAYEELAPQFGYKTRKASAVPWADVPEGNRALMVATAERVVQGLGLPAALGALEEAQGWVRALAWPWHDGWQQCARCGQPKRPAVHLKKCSLAPYLAILGESE